MKYLILVLLFFLSACVSKSNSQNNSALEYERIFQFHVGVTTENDVVKILGKPSGRVERSGYYIIDYHAPQTGFQRVSLSFNNTNNLLSSLLWIPTEGDKEITLDGAKAAFAKENFKVSEVDSGSVHALSKIFLYTDEDLGITIRFNPSSNLVEAIAMYDAQLRAPAATIKK
jgi:hypothetical protein